MPKSKFNPELLRAFISAVKTFKKFWRAEPGSDQEAIAEKDLTEAIIVIVHIAENDS